MKKTGLIAVLLLMASAQVTLAIMERGDYPWGSKLRSYYDAEMQSKYPEVPWLLNLGPTGIRARVYRERPHLLVVKYVFQDDHKPSGSIGEYSQEVCNR